MKTTRRGQATVLSLSTDDLTNPPGVEAAFKEIMSLLPGKQIVVDMQGVTRLTSMGLSVLSAGADLARKDRGRFALAGVRPEVKHLIERSDGKRLMDLADDVESALERMGTDAPPEAPPSEG